MLNKVDFFRKDVTVSVSISISNKRNPQIKYPPVSSQEFLSLQQYHAIAKKVIQSYSKRKGYQLGQSLLNSEDAISYVAEQLMFADWRWQPIRKVKVIGDGGNATTQEIPVSRRAYRSKCGVWAIKSYLTKSQSKKNRWLYSLDYLCDQENTDLYCYLADKKSINPSTKLDDTQQKQVRFFLNNSRLTPVQKDCIKMYFLEGLNFTEIGAKIGSTKQNVQQHVQKAIENMKFVAGVQ